MFQFSVPVLAQYRESYSTSYCRNCSVQEIITLATTVGSEDVHNGDCSIRTNGVVQF